MTVVKLQKASNYSGARLVKLNSALNLLETVINSLDFKDKVLNFEYKGEMTFFYRKNIWRNIDVPRSNSEVYNTIMEALELGEGNERYVIDLYLELIEGSDGNVIG